MSRLSNTLDHCTTTQPCDVIRSALRMRRLQMQGSRDLQNRDFSFNDLTAENLSHEYRRQTLFLSRALIVLRPPRITKLTERFPSTVCSMNKAAWKAKRTLTLRLNQRQRTRRGTASHSSPQGDDATGCERSRNRRLCMVFWRGVRGTRGSEIRVRWGGRRPSGWL